jgi:hypothetical protein
MLLLLHFAAAEVAVVVIGVAFHVAAVVVIGVAFHVAAAVDAFAAVPSTAAAAVLLHY